MDENKTKKHDNTLIIGTALFFDLSIGFITLIIGLIPVVGVVNLILVPILSLIPMFTFQLWFKMRGTNFRSLKRVLALPGAFILESIPFIGLLPGWTATVLILVYTEKLKQATTVSREDIPVTDINKYRRPVSLQENENLRKAA
jgi:uncharacterized membrane protein YkvI